MALARSALGSGARRLDGRAVAVYADNRGDIEIQLVEAGDQFLYCGRSPDLAVARADMIRFDDDLFGRKINDDQILGVRRRQGINLDTPGAVRQHARTAAEGFNYHRRSSFFQAVGLARVRRLGHASVKISRRERADNDGAFGHEGANAASVIEVMVRWDHVK